MSEKELSDKAHLENLQIENMRKINELNLQENKLFTIQQLQNEKELALIKRTEELEIREKDYKKIIQEEFLKKLKEATK
jgi:hypothetical protein